jgi:DNA-binding phage protein
MAEKLTTFDPAEGLTSDEAIASFMAEAFASEDPTLKTTIAVMKALGIELTAKVHSERPRLA